MRGARLTGVDEALAVGGEGVVDLLAAGEDVAEEALVLAVAPLELLELDEEARGLLVAVLGRVREPERVGHALREELHLGGELTGRLERPHALAVPAGDGAHAVELGVDVRHLLDDPRLHVGIGDRERRDELGQEIEPVGDAVEGGEVRGELAGALVRVEPRLDLVHRASVGGERVVAREEIGGALPDRLVQADELLVHAPERVGVDVAVLADRRDVTALAADAGQEIDEGVDAVRRAGLGVGADVLLRLLGPAHRLGRVPADALDLLELVDDQVGGGGDVRERLADAAGLGVGEPVVLVGQARRLAVQTLVVRGRHRVVAHEPGDVEEVRHAAHEIAVADAREKALAGGGGRGVLVARVRGRPDLHRVHARRLVVGREHDDRAVVGERPAVRQDRVLQRAGDQVVGEQREQAAIGLVEDVQHVLAVRRADTALEAEPVDAGPERLPLAGDEVDAVGEDDAVILGQALAGVADRVDAGDRLVARVEHEVAVHALAVGEHAEEEELAHLGPGERGVAERLRRLVDGFRPDGAPALGVVLDPDRQRAARRLDEQAIADVHVRVAPVDDVVAPGLGPLEVVRGRAGEVTLAAVVDVVGRATSCGNAPAEHAQVVEALADAERDEQLAVPLHQLHEAGVAVVAVKLVEVGAEARVVEEASDHRHALDVALGTLPDEAVQRQDVLDAGLGLQADEHVVPEQQELPDLHDVATDAVVLGAHASAGEDSHVARAELARARLVQRPRPRLERPRRRRPADGG